MTLPQIMSFWEFHPIDRFLIILVFIAFTMLGWLIAQHKVKKLEIEINRTRE